MFTLLLLSLLAAVPAGLPSTDLGPTDFYDATDAFLETNVVDGRLDYGALKDEPASLNALVDLIAETNWREMEAGEQKAFLLNAYNVLAIANVVRHYPTESPLKVKGFFDKETFTVGGEEMTLDELEKGTIFKLFPDSRLHFALVCAAEGCPKLITDVYRPATLDQQLADKTRASMSNPMLVRVDGNTLLLSQLFDWYRADFEEEAGSLVGYVNAYRAEPVPENAKVKLFEYDWTLNDR
ncbi:MAG: DUF547 domain-containing protein [Bacteroidota bacterium]